MTPLAGLMASLALRDLRHETRLTLCSVLALAAVLTPLLLLFGFKYGLVEALRTDLIENPRTRTITNQSNRAVDEAFLARLSTRPDVAFVSPRLRTLNNEARFERVDDKGRQVRAEVIASGAGDPLLPDLAPPRDGEMVASASLASRLQVKPGSKVTLRVPRSRDREILEVPLVVTGVAPVASLGRDAAFLSKSLVLLIDDFLDGAVGPDASAASVRMEGRQYAGFRIHARRLQDVITISNDLRAMDIGVDTHAAEIEGLLGLERNLDLLFGLLATLGGLGFMISLGLSLYANVERKQRELSLLRLLGVRRRSLVMIPVLQGTTIALAGAVAAGAFALVTANGLNGLGLAGGTTARPICVLTPFHLWAAVAITVVAAMTAAAFAGRRAALIAPVEGLQDV